MREYNVLLQMRLRYSVSTGCHGECDSQRRVAWHAAGAGRRTIVATVGGIIEGVALLAVVFARRSLLGLLAHLLLAVALEVDLVHGLGVVAQVLRGGQGLRQSAACLDGNTCSSVAGRCRKGRGTSNGCSESRGGRVVRGGRGRDSVEGAV